MNLAFAGQGLEQAFGWVCRTSWEASLLYLLVRLTQFGLRKAWASESHHWLNLLVLARLFLPLSPASSLSLFNWLPEQPSFAFGSLSNPKAECFAMDIAGLGNASAPDPPASGLARRVVTLTQPPFRPSPHHPRAALSRPPSWLRTGAFTVAELLWLGWATGMLLYASFQHCRFARWAGTESALGSGVSADPRSNSQAWRRKNDHEARHGFIFNELQFVHQWCTRRRV